MTGAWTYLKASSYVTISVIWRLAMLIIEKDDVMIAAYSGIATPFRAGVDLGCYAINNRRLGKPRRSKLTTNSSSLVTMFISRNKSEITSGPAYHIQPVDQFNSTIPILLGDIEVVGCIAYNVESSAVFGVAEIVDRVICPDAGECSAVCRIQQVSEQLTCRQNGHVDPHNTLGRRVTVRPP